VPRTPTITDWVEASVPDADTADTPASNVGAADDIDPLIPVAKEPEGVTVTDHAMVPGTHVANVPRMERVVPDAIELDTAGCPNIDPNSSITEP
jgi:hypothetical protein